MLDCACGSETLSVPLMVKKPSACHRVTNGGKLETDDTLRRSQIELPFIHFNVYVWVSVKSRVRFLKTFRI